MSVQNITTMGDEWLTRDNGHERFMLFPIEHNDIWHFYKKAEASFWTVEEVDVANDKFNMLTDEERHFVSHVLAFFATSDTIVNENILQNFSVEITVPEVKQFYTFQLAMEAIHSEMYGQLILTYITDNSERLALFRAIETSPAIARKANWALKYMDSSLPLSTRLLAYSIVEGVFFSGSFCAIYWLKKRGLMPGLTFSNELISRDEGLHTEFSCLMFHKTNRKPTQEEAYAIFEEAVDCECHFTSEALPVSLIGMNVNSMQAYIRFVADRLLISLGYEKHFHDSNPFDWMELISLQGKTNFFEKRVAEYQKAGVMQGGKGEFKLDEDF